MRIVAGRFRGRRLELPAGLDIRPTADRTRQALFDLLEHGHLRADGGSAVVDAVVLDAFAGTGALGLEALSRDAAAASFMDMSRASLDAARANAKALGLDGQFILADVTNPPRARRPADLVFLDPPYDKALAVPSLAALAAAGWIAPGAIVSLELSGRETAAFVAPAGFAKIDERRYGKARILLLRAADRELADSRRVDKDGSSRARGHRSLWPRRLDRCGTNPAIRLYAGALSKISPRPLTLVAPHT